jgi:hypothetical protein
MVASKVSTVNNEEKESPKKAKVRRIIIELNGDDINVPDESEHASSHELVAVLGAVLQKLTGIK